MSNLANMERIDYTLFNCSQEGNVTFNIYNTILLGKKGSEDQKLDPIYTRSYDSSKYSNKDSLDNMKISVSNYLVFSYNDWEEKTSEEIFISYPNMSDLNDFIEEIIEQIVLNDKCFDRRNSVSPAYEDLQIVSEPLAAGKVIKAIPCSVIREEHKDKGVALFINDDDNFIMLTATAMYGIYQLLSEFNLLNTSQLTLLMALSAGDSNGFSGGKLDKRPANPLKKKRPSLRKNKLKMDEDDDMDDEDDIDEEEEEEKPKKKLKPRKKLAKVEELDDDEDVFNDDEDDIDEEEEEEKPKKKLKPRKKVVEEDIDEDDDEEEETPKAKKKKLSMKSIKEAVDEDDEEDDFD